MSGLAADGADPKCTVWYAGTGHRGLNCDGWDGMGWDDLINVIMHAPDFYVGADKPVAVPRVSGGHNPCSWVGIMHAEESGGGVTGTLYLNARQA